MLRAVIEPPVTKLGDNRCKKCGGRDRYISNRACVACTKRRARKQTAAKRAAKPTPNTDPLEGLI
jgi:hypothetical protein